MGTTTTPRPITREEFEAGEIFHLADPLDGKFRYNRVSDFYGPYIHKENRGYYCALYTLEEDGFKFIHFIFGHQFIEKVYFKDCYKV